MTKEKTKWKEFDVVKGLLALLPVERITANIPKLHTALHELYEKQEYKKFLEEYLFEEVSWFPFSDDFATNLVSLEMSGHICFSYKVSNQPEYIFNEKLRYDFEKHTKPLFSESELETITQMSKEFLAYISKTP